VAYTVPAILGDRIGEALLSYTIYLAILASVSEEGGIEQELQIFYEESCIRSHLIEFKYHPEYFRYRLIDQGPGPDYVSECVVSH